MWIKSYSKYGKCLKLIISNGHNNNNQLAIALVGMHEGYACIFNGLRFL